MKCKLRLLPITLVLWGSIALGQTSDIPSGRRITLHEAVQLALQHNHNIHLADSRNFTVPPPKPESRRCRTCKANASSR